jgi:hypothetical protein
VRANYLASPPLVVAYSLLGNVTQDITTVSLGTGNDGQPVYLKDIWPTNKEIADVIASSLSRDQFLKRYAEATKGPKQWQAIEVGMLPAISELWRQVEGNVVPEAVSEAFAAGGFRVIELEEPPKYINVIVGGAATGDGVRLWHGVRLDDLSDCIESLEGTDEQVVPIGTAYREQDSLHLTSMYAAQNAYPYTVPAGMGHTVSLAFAVTDFKLQGRTLPRLILSVGTNRGGMPMRLSKLYVLISRVQAASGLRISLGPWLTAGDLEGVPGAVERGKLRVIAGEPVG